MCITMLFAVRLVGGSSPREGRLEVLNEGVWGGVCVYVNDAAATVVCSMFGFGYAYICSCLLAALCCDLLLLYIL